MFNEWQTLQVRLQAHPEISIRVTRTTPAGAPSAYEVTYNIRSLCGVEGWQHLDEPDIVCRPCYAERFVMDIDLPPGYPGIDAPPAFCFRTTDAEGKQIPHPWHPNIRWFGQMAGRVCINMSDSYTELAWGVLRVAEYLRFERYHATQEPPYPEDPMVARWVIRQGEPNGWI